MANDKKPTPVDESLKLDNQLCFALYSSSRGITKLYRSILSRFDITYPQYLVLLVLWEHGSMNVKRLGERLYLDSGTLTPMLKRMEKQGLITRDRSIKDERQVVIGLAKKGKELEAEAVKIPLELADNLQVSREEYELLMLALKKLLLQLNVS